MKNSTLALFSGIIFLGLTACAGRHRHESFQGPSSVSAEGVITIRTGWLKDKKKSFDAELWFINDSKQAIVVPTSRIRCAKGNITGSFRFTGYGAWMMELQPGEQKKVIAICDTGEKMPGEFLFTFKDIAASTEDGSAGKVLVKELSLKLVPANT